MKVHADAMACVGAGQCVLVAGAVFDQDDDGIVTLLDSDPPPALHGAVRRAATLCPARAIRVDEEA